MSDSQISVDPAAAVSPSSSSFSIGDSLSRGWSEVSGTKAMYWKVLAVFIGISIVVELIKSGVSGEPNEFTLFGFIFGVLGWIISSILAAGLFLVAIRRARGQRSEVNTLFEGMPQAVNICICSFLVSLLSLIGFMLLIVPGLYLAISYLFAPGLVIDKKMGAWEAMETSRKMVTKNWFSYFGMVLALAIILFVSAIPLGVGLIWTVPLMYNVWGRLYVNAFDRAA